MLKKPRHLSHVGDFSTLLLELTKDSHNYQGSTLQQISMEHNVIQFVLGKF